MNIQVNVAEAERRKRLGQYFSGLQVGRLLAAIAHAETARTIIDPMVGSGDLIEACALIGARPALAVGMEIDRTAARAAAARLPAASVIHGSAFDPGSVRRLPAMSFDLVIGNPPFVRYQQGTAALGDIPDAGTVRRHLRQTLDILPLSDGDRSILVKATTSYSGHADLAVPACLLSMALVAPRGRLALVLPQAWLARNYSAEVRSVLHQLFDIEAIVEDDSASWFPHALVKTSLLVARRRTAHLAEPETEYLHIHLGRDAADGDSLVGRLMRGAQDPERAFATSLHTGSSFFSGRELIRAKAARLSSINGTPSDGFGDASLQRIAAQLGMEPVPTSTLRDLGVVVGQGLRTGANDFFYVRPTADGRGFTSALSSDLVECGPEVLRPALKDQRGRRHAVLDLRGVALPEDMRTAGTTPYAQMPRALAEHVRRAARSLSGKPGRERPIPELSAVRTNVRPARRDAPPRFWYMLPDFQPRHLPDVYVPRVCAGQPRAAASDRTCLVDANFATMRCDGIIDRAGLVAIMRSNWVWAWLETAGAVMGGGALKIESTMLERMPIPRLSKQQVLQLNSIGQFILHAPHHVKPHQIDEIMLSGIEDAAKLAGAFEALATSRLMARGGAKA